MPCCHANNIYSEPLPCSNLFTCSFNAAFSLIKRDNTIANATQANAKTMMLTPAISR